MSESTHHNEPCDSKTAQGGVVGRTARNYLVHLKRNWSGGGKGKAIVVAEMLGIFAVISAVGGEDTPQSTSAAHANSVFSSPAPGREVEVGIASPNEGSYVKYLNAALGNVRCYISEEQELILRFRFDYDVFTATAEAAGIWNQAGSDNFPTPSLIVRLFDKNGNYLNHFTTDEMFAPQAALDIATRDGRSVRPFVGTVPVAIPTEGIQLAYGVNVRDLDYTAYVEVGTVEWKNWVCVRHYSEK